MADAGAIDATRAPRATAADWRSLASPLIAVLGIYALALTWTLLVRFPLLGLDWIDEPFYVEVAHLWTKGVPPYLGAFDVKPPGFFALVAASELTLGPTAASIKAVGIAMDAVTATALFFLGRLAAPRVGLFAALLFPPLSELVCFNDFYCALSAFVSLAFVAALSPLRLLIRAALAGLAAGAAISVKQTAGLEAIVLLVAFARSPGETAGRRTVAAISFAAGAAVVPLGFLAYFASRGAANEFVGDTVFRALARPGSAAEGASFVDGVLRFIPLHFSILGLFGAACLALLRRRTLAEAFPRAPLGILEAWLIAGFIATLLQRALHVAYVGQTLPPALLLAAALAAARTSREAARASGWAGLAILAIVSLTPALARFGGHLSNNHPDRAIAQAAAAIRAAQPSGADRLLAVNRGLWINASAGLDPPTPYIHPSHILCQFEGPGDDTLADALAAAPRFIVVADRRSRLSCELSARWELLDSTLRDAYRLLVHAADAADSYDVFQRAPAHGR